ncbi:MAG: efflux RND transporter periplasmic adaptor subunit [Pirellulales bacterium]|nr:efflux RND transporter periplasmic adaptor subunit [Pirellulales bacterium]
MKPLTEKLLHYLLLIVITFFCMGVMWKISAKDQASAKRDGGDVRPLAVVAAPKAPVKISPLHVQICEITNTYAGKIQPWEKYQVGFSVGGRVIALGTNEAGVPLDEGHRVRAGQVLATLDDRVFRAQKSEASAQIERATSELQRAERVRRNSPSAVTESELEGLVTNLALAKAQYDISLKNLDDATLKSPIAATISKRLIKSGESVSPNNTVFELVENEDVLLVLNVPETHIRELEERMREVEQHPFRKTLSSQSAAFAPPPDHVVEESVFRAHVHLEGRDRFGAPWPTLEGEVFRIPQVSDARTGLFPLEIRLSNQERLLRPGMVATADVVTASLSGYRVPESAVLFRQDGAHLFSVTREPASMEMLYWTLGESYIYRAQRVPLKRWIDQGETVFVPAEEVSLSSVVVRGHFRLADRQLLRVVNLGTIPAGDLHFSMPSPQAKIAPGKSDL